MSENDASSPSSSSDSSQPLGYVQTKQATDNSMSLYCHVCECAPSTFRVHQTRYRDSFIILAQCHGDDFTVEVPWLEALEKGLHFTLFAPIVEDS